jgi:hypothetical protein
MLPPVRHHRTPRADESSIARNLDEDHLVKQTKGVEIGSSSPRMAEAGREAEEEDWLSVRDFEAGALERVGVEDAIVHKVCRLGHVTITRTQKAGESHFKAATAFAELRTADCSEGSQRERRAASASCSKNRHAARAIAFYDY